ncbi:hypothetical protein [Stenotrophomonas rhizophila]|uniref:hypothetical protein n=1 Tax=Stenotrophomonas rhizophila TaxID=216778 RepID=UPI001E3AD0F5|nr:hypothetical protein [Stenotrophomonas rhizophila]MCC7633625.1 hypothetical protein [Stenotrophomonas rhizophila]MCC7663571.1 hypothetical protein [Stenotrophomonas rhizophila]
MTGWLTSKGVLDVAERSGSFASETPGGGGTFTREIVEVDYQYAEELILRERANEAQEFVTRVCVVATDERVAVFASVSASNLGTKIAPRSTSARCPAVLREMIRLHRDWEIDGAQIPSGRPRTFTGPEGGAEVCKIILSGQRKFPLILVSEDDDEFVWDGLDKKLASDLVGLGYVSTVDSDAAWEISSRLGRRAACFDGAVRIYWPNIGTSLDQLVSTVWTLERMLDAPANTNAEDRFREQLRQRVMAASALSITEPAEIGSVFRAQTRKRLAELQGNASMIDGVYEIANSLADDLDKANRRITDLETELSVEKTRAENAEVQLGYAGQTPAANDATSADSEEHAVEDEEGGQGDIQAGQAVFYKKVSSTPNFDIMRRRGDCGHNSWESAHAADKAWKGVERLELRKDWRSFLHCSRCKGGGVWKVTF